MEGEALAEAGLDLGLVLAPGNVFSPDRNAGPFMRFNVAQMEDPGVFHTLQQAMAKVA